MKKYEVEYTETLYKTVTIMASSLEEALKKAEEAYKNESVVLTAEDFSDGSIVTTDLETLEDLRLDF